MSIYTSTGQSKANHIHSLDRIDEPPYKYRCRDCGELQKRLNGVLIAKPVPKKKQSDAYPHCRYCEKRLRPMGPTERGVKQAIENINRLYGQNPARAEIEIAATRARYERNKGRFGSYGDNLFCGLTCGWRWAVKKLTPATAV